MNVMPIVGGGVGRIDVERLDRVCNLQHAFDVGPTGEPQQDVAAGPHVGHRHAALTGRDCPDDVDARDDRAEIVRGPAHEREYATWRKRKNAPSLIENLFLCGATEANPVLDALLQPQELDMGEIAHAISPSPENC
jgi:hypothetical protein